MLRQVEAGEGGSGGTSQTLLEGRLRHEPLCPVVLSAKHGGEARLEDVESVRSGCPIELP